MAVTKFAGISVLLVGMVAAWGQGVKPGLPDSPRDLPGIAGKANLALPGEKSCVITLKIRFTESIRMQKLEWFVDKKPVVFRLDKPDEEGGTPTPVLSAEITVSQDKHEVAFRSTGNGYHYFRANMYGDIEDTIGKVIKAGIVVDCKKDTLDVSFDAVPKKGVQIFGADDVSHIRVTVKVDKHDQRVDAKVKLPDGP